MKTCFLFRNGSIVHYAIKLVSKFSVIEVRATLLNLLTTVSGIQIYSKECYYVPLLSRYHFWLWLACLCSIKCETPHTFPLLLKREKKDIFTFCSRTNYSHRTSRFLGLL